VSLSWPAFRSQRQVEDVVGWQQRAAARAVVLTDDIAVHAVREPAAGERVADQVVVAGRVEVAAHLVGRSGTPAE